MAVPGDDDTNSAPDDVVRVEILPKLDGGLYDALAPEEDDNKDVNNGSDTSRVVNSAISYARECLRSENYTEATIALRSVLEITKPSSDSYKMIIMHLAQLLKAAQQLKPSIDCMLSVYQKIPPPFSRTEGICIIARIYEQLDSMDAAHFWLKKLVGKSDSGSIDFPVKPNFLAWEAMADRLFDGGLYMFAADFYGQALTLAPEKTFVPTNRFRHRYLVALLAFIGPQGPTMHMNLCREVAWSMAQWFRRQNGNHISACYVDHHYYRMRMVYFTTFPAIYRAVFAWIDMPAGRIARWWRRQWARLRPPPVDSMSSNSRAKRKGKQKLTRPTAPSTCTLDQQPQVKVHPFLRRKVLIHHFPLPRSPSPTRKTRDRSNKQTTTTPISCDSGTRTEKTSDTSCKLNTVQQPNRKIAVLSNNASSNNDIQQLPTCTSDTIKQSSDAQRKMKVRSVSKKPVKYYGGFPPNRSIVRCLRRTGSSGELTDDQPSFACIDEISEVEAQSVTRSSSTNLLDVYPLQLPSNESFLAICGREPGFADLNLDELSAFARLAHYRAQVLTGKNVRVDNLDTTRVKPQWLQDVEKAISLVETHQQRNVASGKVMADGDSIAHLSEVHTRLVLLVTTLCRQYTRDFGETSFTRRLRALTRRLIEWKFSRIPEVIAALNDAKSVATHEEKQRNLEFYHVHRDRKGEIQSKT